MKKTFFTIRELTHPDQLNRSHNWIRRAIQLGKIEAEKFGNTYAVSAAECDRVKKEKPVISRKEFFGGVEKA